MDKNTIIGLGLIIALLLGWQYFATPSKEELAKQKKVRDSLAMVNKKALDAKSTVDSLKPVSQQQALPDSARAAQQKGNFGPFAASSVGAVQESVLENDLFKVNFSNKGGRITSVELKNYKKLIEDDKGKQSKVPLLLLEDAKNQFSYFLPVADLPSGGVQSSDLYFNAEQSDNSITFRANAGEGRYFEQRYTIKPGTYEIDYQIKFEGLNQVLAGNTDQIMLRWKNFLDKIEINTKYERNYATVYYKVAEDDPTYCSCTSEDSEDLKTTPITWVSHTNQFFNSSLMAKSGNFKGGTFETHLIDMKQEDLKRLNSDIYVPYNGGQSESFQMAFFIGPNEFNRLYAMGNELQDIIPFGSSIFGTINRWVIRPIFNFLSGFIGSKGIVILMLTLFVKILVFPLTYRMIHSQSKMGVLKPQLESLKAKYKDDPQQQQVETMKIYREFGVNPLGGCLPMLLQMPIWFALYRFFPASIEFRQASFLWATDLSSYDVIARLPFEIPLGFGAHLSLFTLLWAVSTLVYTYYNTQNMDFSANPAMKYMQYIMPVMFLGFFNSFASGLTCYLLFSNLINIGQTIATKQFLIDENKLRDQLEENRKKPKKKGGFQERLEAALKEQQRVQTQREQDKKNQAKNKK